MTYSSTVQEPYLKLNLEIHAAKNLIGKDISGIIILKDLNPSHFIKLFVDILCLVLCLINASLLIAIFR